MIKKLKTNLITAVIEMPSQTKYKYEMKNGALVLDRVNPIAVPYNYGFVKHTKEADGDSADIFIVSKEAIPPKTEVKVSPVVRIRCLDNSVKDDKFVAFLEPRSESEMEAAVASIVHYLTHYKAGFRVLQIEDMAPAFWDTDRNPFKRTLLGKLFRFFGKT